MSTTRSDFAISIRVPAYRNGLLAEEQLAAGEGSRLRPRALDQNAHQIQVKALISSAFTKTRDLQNLVTNGSL